MSRRSAPTLLLALTGALGLVSCVPEHGSNGPELAQPASGTGPCFEADVTDGVNDGAEVQLLFDCFNQHGAFEPLAPTVSYLAENPDLTDALEAMEGPSTLPDLQEGLDTATGLLNAPEQPIQGGLDIYVEVYESGILARGVGLMTRGAAELSACEEGEAPATCSLLRMAYEVLTSENRGRLERIMDALETEPPTDEELQADLEQTAELLRNTSTAEWNDNVLVETGLLFLEPRYDGRSSLQLLQPWVEELLAEDRDGDSIPDLAEALAPYIAQSWRSGDLQQLPQQLADVNNLDVDGNEVTEARGNISMLQQLTLNLESLSSDADPTMLFEPMQIGSATLTPFDAGLNFVHDYYDELDSGRLSGQALEDDMIDRVDSIIDDVCVAVGRNDPFCRQMGFIGDALTAIIDTGLPVTGLPVAHGFLEAVNLYELVPAVHPDGTRLQDLSTEDFLAVTEWADEISVGMEPMSRVSLDANTLPDTLDLLPTFIDMNTGALTLEGGDAMALARWAVTATPHDVGGSYAPLEIPQQVAVGLLSDTGFVQDLDWIQRHVADAMTSEGNPLSISRLLELKRAMIEHVPEADVDPLVEAESLLANEALWTAGLRLGADARLGELLSPEEGTGGPWYLYDLIQRGVLDRVLSFVTTLLDTLQGDDEPSE
ncbi:MAG: hypothetical protein H6741_23625 [Alphaproteobacteria bacterium]|nr:hypothetical protein [Alphaproteobacteria bacterium]MCB9795698.1 hypothetical protein [Alphaproteobacteria bacterium]